MNFREFGLRVGIRFGLFLGICMALVGGLSFGLIAAILGGIFFGTTVSFTLYLLSLPQRARSNQFSDVAAAGQ